ncbi:hypothetical protein KEM55_009216 [Ascosphaera atra]|nr:hypothetical protein KEM55_009216 [Ascosphaera atra]
MPPVKARVWRTRMSGSAAGGGRTAPSRSSLAEMRRLYSFSFASLRSTSTLPSKLTPANRPLVLE